jgi:hypothetical protein
MNKADEFSQATKRKILTEDRDRLATYHALAQSSIDDERGGRYAAVSRPATFVGASPIHQYPRLPADSPWHSDPCPPEPPLGYSVNDQEPVGERWEQEAVAERWSAAGGTPRCDVAEGVGALGISPRFPPTRTMPIRTSDRPTGLPASRGDVAAPEVRRRGWRRF